MKIASRTASLIALSLAFFAAPAWGAPVLKADIKVERDVVTLGDLVDGVEARLAATPLFGAPKLGEHGTIQVQRILLAAGGLGVVDLDTAGLVQVNVARPARRIGVAEVEKTLRAAISQRQGRDASGLAFVYDSVLPSLVLPTSVDGPLVVEDLSFDPRARRVTANLAVAALDGSRRKTLRVTGSVVETAPIAILTRPINRGDRIEAGDVVIERRPRETVTPDSVGDLDGAIGQVAKRAFTAGAVLRSADLAKPEIVARGEIVTLVYERDGMTLTTRGKAAEGGGLGDTVAVQNIQSKRTLQGTVSGPGRVTVSTATPGRVAVNDIKE